MPGLNFSNEPSIRFVKVGFSNLIPGLIPVGTEKHQVPIDRKSVYNRMSHGITSLRLPVKGRGSK